MIDSAAQQVARPSARPKGRARESRWFPWLLFAPAIAFLVVMTIFPLFFSLVVSLFDYVQNSSRGFVGLGNYWSILKESNFWLTVWNTARITATAVAVELGLGLLLGFLLNQKLRGMGVFRIIILLPMMLAPLVIGLFWQFMFDGTFGVIGYFTSVIGLGRTEWLTDSTRALAAIIIVDVWQWTPFVILLVLAGLHSVPDDVKEAAAMDRATRWMRFRHIILPFLKFPLTLALLFRAIDTIKLFDLSYIMTFGGPGDDTQTLSLFSYKLAFKLGFQQGKAAAISWLIVIAINVLVMILLRFLNAKKKAVEVVDTGL